MKRRINIFNTLHYPVEVAGYTFPPGEEVWIVIEVASSKFKKIRSIRGLRVGKTNNHIWKEKYMQEKGYDFNMIYDANQLPRSSPYTRVIESLANPVIKYLPDGEAGYLPQPTVRGINLRFFCEARIMQQGKRPVGPQDIFMSHGLADKNYWTGEMIKKFSNVLVPGPAWKERMRRSGYEGRIHVVGYTKLDPAFNGEYKKQRRERPYIVWAPTHSYHNAGGRSTYPECMKLINEIPDCYEKAVALHPSGRKNYDVTLQELVDADVVIADTGSTLYEAWALGKPVIFPDWICKDPVFSYFKSDPDNLEYRIYSEGIGYHAKDMTDLNNLIEKALAEGMREEETEFIERIFPSELRGKSGEKAAKVLVEIKGELERGEVICP